MWIASKGSRCSQFLRLQTIYWSNTETFKYESCAQHTTIRYKRNYMFVLFSQIQQTTRLEQMEFYPWPPALSWRVLRAKRLHDAVDWDDKLKLGFVQSKPGWMRGETSYFPVLVISNVTYFSKVRHLFYMQHKLICDRHVYLESKLLFS